jgi:hypothetical protein
MTVDAADAVPAPSSAAERMRRYRKRRREAKQRQADGTHDVQVVLGVTEIEALVRMGFLREEDRHDPASLQVATQGLIYHVVEDPACSAAIAQRNGRSRR